MPNTMDTFNIPELHLMCAPGKGLGFVSEQGVEASHSRFLKFCN